MSTRTISENVISTISKGPLVIFVMLGLAIWQASKMTEQQIQTLDKLVDVLNNAVGFGLLFLVILLLIFVGLLYPAGKFLASFSKELIDQQKDHGKQHKEHVEASKGMFHLMSSIQDMCKDTHDKINRFYGES